MSNKISRHEFLANSTKIAAGIAAGTLGMRSLSLTEAQADTQTTPWPWPYAQLDAEAVRVLGHDLFWNGKACSAGAFGAIITALQNTVGAPFTDLPIEILLYGHGGGAGWGTICGALNGSSAAISLVCDKATSDMLISELIGWYTQVELPSALSNQYAVNHTFTDNRCDVELLRNACGSPLCHVSVTEWCKTASHKVADLERKERCARVAGDVAAYAVKLLNDNLAGTFVPAYVPPETIAACMTCHGGAMLDNVAANMECQQCHDDPHASTVEDNPHNVPTSYEIKPNYPNPFNPETNFEFTLPQSEKVSLKIFDLNGRLIQTIINGDAYAPGSYTAHWDGRNKFGQNVSSGMYYFRFQAGSFIKSRSMTLIK